MGWNADDPGTVEQTPTGKAILPRGFGEWFDGNQMRRTSFTDMLRIHGISPVEVESVRLLSLRAARQMKVSSFNGRTCFLSVFNPLVHFATGLFRRGTVARRAKQ